MSFDATDYSSREIAAHIQELEERIQKMELEMDTLLSRISEAQRILQGFRVSTLGTVAAPVIEDALNALEGK